MKKYMRLLTGALALLMCVGVFASCKKKDDDATEDTSQVTTAGGDETTSNVDAKGYLLDDLGDKDFGGKEIKILTWINKSYSQFEFDTEKGDHTNKFEEAVFNRNEQVARRMNVKLKWNSIEGNNSNMTNYITQARALSVTSDVDIFAA